VRAAAIMKGHLLNQRKTAKRRVDPKWLAAAASVSRGLRRTPEGLAVARMDLERCMDRLVVLLDGDEPALDVVRAIAEGYETPREQAEYLKRDIDEIRNARKRVARAVDAVNAAEGDAEHARDWEAGEGAGVDYSADVAGADEEGEPAEE
jgi:hypothetical protein